MIIRRKHTKHFVTLANAMVRDTRLTLDEHGMLHYLLSLPDDWEVSRANCAKYWGIGREKAARIFRALRKTGWARVERVHAEDGTFLGSRWVIYDEPGAELADSELGADDAAEDATDDAALPGNPADGPGPGKPDEAPDPAGGGTPAATNAPADSDHDTAQPEYGSTGVRVNRNTANPYRGYKDSTKTESHENRDSRIPPHPPDDGAGKPAFGDMQAIWGQHSILSPHACEKLWHRLPAGEARDAIRHAPAYLAECVRKGQKVCDLATYLRERRWQRLAKTGAAGGSVPSFEIKPYTPQWHRWREYHIAMGEPTSFMESRARNGQHWWARAEWPPPIPEERRAKPPPARGSPGDGEASQMSDDDVAAFVAAELER